MRSHWLKLALAALAATAALGATACRGAQEDAAPAGEEPVAEATAAETAPEAAGAASTLPLDTFVSATIGEPESLDPPWTYETTGSTYEALLYDSPVAFEREKPDAFVPALATEWEVSDDGLTYVFTIREGVTFHEGGTLEPSDIAYSLQRGMLQDRVDGPMVLFLEPILGTTTIQDLAMELGGVTAEDATMADVPNQALVDACELVKAAVTADDEAGTVAITLEQATPWFLQLMAQPWSAALDMQWMVEQGDWDGNCAGADGTATWTEWHAPAAEETVLFNRANGTGPYKLDQWKTGEEITFDANEAYWRTEPAWEGGPSGPAALKRLVFQKVDEWGTRLAKLEAGEADSVVVPRANIDQVEGMIHTRYDGGDTNAPATVQNPDGTLNLYIGYPTQAMTAAMFNFDINPESEFIGTGALGDGIPIDFFADLDVRKAFNYCFDWDTMIQDGLKGEGVQARGPIIEGLQGFDPSSPVYTYDLDLCGEHLAKAWGGQVAEQGFAMTLAYNEGNDTRQTAAEILAENLALVDPKYKVDVQSLEWPSFLEARRLESLPIAISGWQADYYDASNWVHPFMHSQGAYGRAQGFPAELQARIDALIDEALVEPDATRRDELYAELQQIAHDEAIDVFLFQATGRSYLNRQVQGYYVNSLAPGTYHYALSKQP